VFDPVYVFRWIVAIFVAGFIGYFGKFLAKIVISKLHKRKEKEKLDKYRFKLEKEKIRKKLKN